MPGNQYFAKRLSNEGKLKRASEFQEKFPHVLKFFRNFLRLKCNIAQGTRSVLLRSQDSILLALPKKWTYNDRKVAALGLMDLWEAPTTAEQDTISRDTPFFMYIEKMQKITRSLFSDPKIWVWILMSEVLANQSAEFVRRFLLEYEAIHSLYHVPTNEWLDDAKTWVPSTTVYLLFLVK